MIPQWILAGLWGAVAGSALVLGALAGYLAPLPRKVIAGVMAFGGGVLISALAFELMDAAYDKAGVPATATGFLLGATAFTLADAVLRRHGAGNRKRSRPHHSERGRRRQGSGRALAVGSLLDSVPEALAIGASLTVGGAVAWVTVAAVFLSNVPEGMSSAAGMRNAGQSKAYVFGLWGAIGAATALAAIIGQIALVAAPPWATALVVSWAAGAILAMLANTMMPEAFEVTHAWTGIITVIGFLMAFVLSKMT